MAKLWNRQTPSPYIIEMLELVLNHLQFIWLSPSPSECFYFFPKDQFPSSVEGGHLLHLSILITRWGRYQTEKFPIKKQAEIVLALKQEETASMEIN